MSTKLRLIAGAGIAISEDLPNKQLIIGAIRESIVGGADLSATEDTVAGTLTLAVAPRAADPTQAPSGLTGTLVQWLSWFCNRILAITGGTHWYDAPAITLLALAGHAARHATGGADALTPSAIGAEPALGNPASNGMVLASTTAGARSWVAAGAAAAITSAATATWTEGDSVSYAITANNTPAAFAAPNLPTGLAIDGTSGEITGTAPAAGAYALVLLASGASGLASGALTVTVNAAAIPYADHLYEADAGPDGAYPDQLDDLADGDPLLFGGPAPAWDELGLGIDCSAQGPLSAVSTPLDGTTAYTVLVIGAYGGDGCLWTLSDGLTFNQRIFVLDGAMMGGPDSGYMNLGSLSSGDAFAACVSTDIDGNWKGLLLNAAGESAFNTTGSAPELGAFYLANQADGSFPWSGVIGVVAIWSQQLSDADRRAAINAQLTRLHLSGKYLTLNTF